MLTEINGRKGGREMTVDEVRVALLVAPFSALPSCFCLSFCSLAAFIIHLLTLTLPSLSPGHGRVPRIR